MDKNKMILYGAAAAFVVLVICMFFTGSEGKEPEERKKNEVIEVPDGNAQEVTESKSEGYQRGNRNSASTEYWNSFDAAPVSSEALKDSTEKMFGKGSQSPAGGYTPPPSNAPYRETPQEREARHRRRHEEAMELAERLTAEERQEDDNVYQDEKEERIQITEPISVTRHSSVISSLDDDSSSGISSLDDDGMASVTQESHPIKCMFARESKVKNGQRVSVILLEEIVVSGIRVPKNTHLMATCKLSDRLELDFENIEIGGRILHLGYEAYDVDGSKGIYCPDVANTGKQVRSRGSNIISSTLTGRMGRLAGEVLSSGISIAQSAGGEVTVNVPGGYTFYIVKIRR